MSKRKYYEEDYGVDDDWYDDEYEEHIKRKRKKNHRSGKYDPWDDIEE